MPENSPDSILRKCLNESFKDFEDAYTFCFDNCDSDFLKT